MENGRVDRPSRKALTWNSLALATAALCVSITSFHRDPGWELWLRLAFLAYLVRWLIKNRGDRWPGAAARRPGDGNV
ncbi:hypothetical protein [Streptomyces sp. NPDC048639]|uniref:hypothetical protein n=1 Tax=Streptomyces sp. NPDC048639 TaxID=3365581 RepID=UPI003717C9BE